MTAPRIVTPEEAQGRLRNISPTVDADNDHLTLLNTVATEPDRIAAAYERGYLDADNGKDPAS